MRDTYYLKLSCDHLHLRHLESGREFELQAVPAFSNVRLLVADFSAAQQVLKQALSRLQPRRWLTLPPSLLIQPLERLEGGLSMIEERILLELGMGCGARRVRLHVGAELDDVGVRARLSS
ncbi:MAG: hypothetical protein K2Y25_12925 [Pseudomonadaceae bacterium]|jgi:hypothetical protein|nr:hypothetical protein [Pseudomonadaceae bacterium]